MGYGQNLKKILDEKNVSVKELSRQTGIAATTLYSIIKRDTAMRYDFALRVANVLDIPVHSICKNDPYEEGETEPGLLKDFGGLATNLNKSTYFSNRTFAIAKNFDYKELPMLDELIADFYVLDDTARQDTFKFIQMMKESHSDAERVEQLKKLKK